MLQEVFPHARADIARVQADHCEALPFQVIGQHCCLCVPHSTLIYLTEPGYAKDMLEVALVGPLTSGATEEQASSLHCLEHVTWQQACQHMQGQKRSLRALQLGSFATVGLHCYAGHCSPMLIATLDTR